MDLASCTLGERVEVREGVIGVRVVIRDALCAAEDGDNLSRRVIAEDPAVDVSRVIGDVCQYREAAGIEAKIIDIGRHAEVGHLSEAVEQGGRDALRHGMARPGQRHGQNEEGWKQAHDWDMKRDDFERRRALRTWKTSDERKALREGGARSALHIALGRRGPFPTRIAVHPERGSWGAVRVSF